MKSKDMQQTMVNSLTAIEGMDGLSSFVETKRLPQGFFDQLARFYEAYDRYIDHVIASENLAVSCQSGCGACCEYELARGVSALEALHIYHHIRSWPDIGDIYEACGANMVTFQKLLYGLIQRDGQPLTPEDPRIHEAHMAYIQLKRPCAFLDRDSGQCRIYPVRPIVCRFFFSFSPAQWCNIGHPNWPQRDSRHINLPQEAKVHLEAINARLNIRTLNFLAGAFVTTAGDVMQGAPTLSVFTFLMKS